MIREIQEEVIDKADDFEDDYKRCRIVSNHLSRNNGNKI